MALECLTAFPAKWAFYISFILSQNSCCLQFKDFNLFPKWPNCNKNDSVQLKLCAKCFRKVILPLKLLHDQLRMGGKNATSVIQFMDERFSICFACFLHSPNKYGRAPGHHFAPHYCPMKIGEKATL